VTGRALAPAAPGFGSYDAAEVTWLLTDLSAVSLEQELAVRERAAQLGGHYAESLPIEYQPEPAYLDLFHAALRASAARVALAVGVVAELVAARAGGRPVLVSLARAGTPTAILLRRWLLATRGPQPPHYAVSIVRGRGLDLVALDHVLARHPAAAVRFVDGWTGKGAIARELAGALAAAGSVVDPKLAVLADPGGCTTTFGTREDFLVPSACLNSTVSGLVSRTVLRADLIGPGMFHGAKSYPHLAPADVSALFLDTITARFEEVRGAAVAAAAAHLATPPPLTWAGEAAVQQISDRLGIADRHLVKPGVGETTRVLLRRVPELVLVHPDRVGELGHVLLLARQRGVPVVEDASLPYACVGVIRTVHG